MHIVPIYFFTFLVFYAKLFPIVVSGIDLTNSLPQAGGDQNEILIFTSWLYEKRSRDPGYTLHEKMRLGISFVSTKIYMDRKKTLWSLCIHSQK